MNRTLTALVLGLLTLGAGGGGTLPGAALAQGAGPGRAERSEGERPVPDDPGAPQVQAPVVAPPACSAPPLPERFRNVVEQNRFVAEAQAYRGCLERYIAERRAAAAAHTRAGNEAAAAWNRFAEGVSRIEPPPER